MKSSSLLLVDPLQLPKLYAIVDTGLSDTGLNLGAVTTAHELLRGGATLLQYRHKGEFTRRHWEECCAIARFAHDAGAMFIVNDRVDIAMMSGADGVHLGQDDLPADAARQLLGASQVIGVSTHSATQVIIADRLPVDYIAIGPVFATSTKDNPDPVVGLAGVSAARLLTTKPLVAIGGITRDNAPLVLGAGADSVAVVRDLLSTADIAQAARDFLAVLSRCYPGAIL